MGKSEVYFRTVNVQVGNNFGTRSVEASFTEELATAQVVIQGLDLQTHKWDLRMLRQITVRPTNVQVSGQKVSCDLTYGAGENPKDQAPEWSLHGTVTLLFIGIGA